MQSSYNSHNNSHHNGRQNSNLVPLENEKTENRASDLHWVNPALPNPYPYRLRLWDLHAAQIRETGRIDDPDLLHHLQQVFEVARADGAEVLLPETIAQLKMQLQKEREEMGRGCQQLLDLLESAGSEAFRSMTPDLDAQMQRVLKAIERILAIAHHHLETGAPQSQRSPSSSFPWLTEDLEIARKHCNDLKYIRQYLIERARSGIVDRELQRPGGAHPRHRRLQKYLQLLPRLSGQAIFFIEVALEGKVAGAKFSRLEDRDRDA